MTDFFHDLIVDDSCRQNGPEVVSLSSPSASLPSCFASRSSSFASLLSSFPLPVFSFLSLLCCLAPATFFDFRSFLSTLILLCSLWLFVGSIRPRGFFLLCST